MQHIKCVLCKLYEKGQNLFLAHPEQHTVLMVEAETLPLGLVAHKLHVGLESVRVPRQTLLAHV